MMDIAKCLDVGLLQTHEAVIVQMVRAIINGMVLGTKMTELELPLALSVAN